jgi:hypothetical protein
MIASFRAFSETTPHRDRTSWPIAGERIVNRGNLSETDCRRERIRAVFGIPAHAPLPQVRPETVLHYHRYLAHRLSFPFQAVYFDPHEGAACDNLVTATRLVEPVNAVRNSRAAIECVVMAGDYPVHVRLDALRPAGRSGVQQTLDDYRYWLDTQH